MSQTHSDKDNDNEINNINCWNWRQVLWLGRHLQVPKWLDGKSTSDRVAFVGGCQAACDAGWSVWSNWSWYWTVPGRSKVTAFLMSAVLLSLVGTTLNCRLGCLNVWKWSMRTCNFRAFCCVFLCLPFNLANQALMSCFGHKGLLVKIVPCFRKKNQKSKFYIAEPYVALNGIISDCLYICIRVLLWILK